MNEHKRSVGQVDGDFGAPRGLTAVGDAADAYMKRREAQRRLSGTSSVRFIPRPISPKKRRVR